MSAIASARPARAPRAASTRADNRLPAVLDAAARLFASGGYSATSMRDIALACEMLPGSLYYHFAAKEDLLAEVYRRGVEQLRESVEAAIYRSGDPWERLEAACAAHLETILRRSDYAQVLIRVMPSDVPGAAERLRALREQYEHVFRDLIAALPLPANTNRRTLRLMLLGALNWSRLWFDESGRETPASLARKFIRFLKESQDGTPA
jgi:AcrR family transcriptional regulator